MEGTTYRITGLVRRPLDVTFFRHAANVEWGEGRFPSLQITLASLSPPTHLLEFLGPSITSSLSPQKALRTRNGTSGAAWRNPL